MGWRGWVARVASSSHFSRARNAGIPMPAWPWPRAASRLTSPPGCAVPAASCRAGGDGAMLAQAPLALLPMDAELRDTLTSLGLATAGQFRCARPRRCGAALRSRRPGRLAPRAGRGPAPPHARASRTGRHRRHRTPHTCRYTRAGALPRARGTGPADHPGGERRDGGGSAGSGAEARCIAGPVGLASHHPRLPTRPAGAAVRAVPRDARGLDPRRAGARRHRAHHRARPSLGRTGRPAAHRLA